MKNNSELQTDVQNAIKWEPLLTAAQIGVTAKDGIVTLSGVVDTYAKKTQAETAAKNVSGVKVVAEGVETREQFETLKTMGFDALQGFYLARPMPASEIPALIDLALRPALSLPHSA